MPKILAYLTFVLTLLVAHKALACDEGERQVGPLCVGTALYKVGAFNVPYDTARLEDDSSKTVVWEGNGYVDSATRTKMDVIEKRLVPGKGVKDVHVFYYWNGEKFVEKKPKAKRRR
jgi:hypothetical protein